MDRKFISFIDFTKLNDEDKYKLLILRENKIDKAIEILNDGLKQLDERNRCEVYSEEYLENARDILKEDK